MRRIGWWTALALVTGLVVAPVEAQARGEFDLQAHLGGAGLRPESTLSAFGNALRLGVSTLELAVQITEDGQVVVTRHPGVVNCADTAPVKPGDPEFPYVGKLVRTLTAAQIQTLDCGAGARMPRLRQVFDLVGKYQADSARLTVELGVGPDSASREQFAKLTVQEIKDAGFAGRVAVGSRDWAALTRVRQIAPKLPLVAVADSAPGGDPIAAVKSLGADTFSPGYAVTKDLVRRAHRSGIKVVPWTINDPATMSKLIGDGVDGIITDYPDRLRDVVKQHGFRLPRGYASPFDIQAHRGGRAVRPENTLAAFGYSLADKDVSTLEMDIGITQDDQLVVSHDQTVNGSLCLDTAPAKPGDPEFPYVGKPIRELTLAQLKTLDCGSKTVPSLPKQIAVPGERMPTLAEVFALAKSSGRADIRFNIETKLSPIIDNTAPYWQFTVQLIGAIEGAGLAHRATVQSFDWRTIRLAKAIDSRIETVALVWQYGPEECKTLADECSLQAAYGDPSLKSPWTGGLDWWQFKDLGKLVRAAGASTVSSNWQVHDPHQGKVVSTDWYLRQDPAYYFGPDAPALVAKGLKVVPYTVNDEPTIQRVIDLGVTGIISDDPDVLIAVARRNGLR